LGLDFDKVLRITTPLRGGTQVTVWHTLRLSLSLLLSQFQHYWNLFYPSACLFFLSSFDTTRWALEEKPFPPFTRLYL